MKFYAATDMKIGDIFSPDDSDYCGFELKKADDINTGMAFHSSRTGQRIILSPIHFTLTGQIIKKKQETVTAEEASSAFMDKDGWAKVSTYKQAFIKGFNISAKNERLHYAELVELLEEYANSGVGEYPRNFEDRMVNAFNKIKQHEAE